MQGLLTLVDACPRGADLSVNHTRIEIVVTVMTYTWDKSCNLKLVGQELVWKDSVKYLGVIIDSKISWKENL